MSSVIFALDESQIMIATDTLCKSVAGHPSFFGSKAITIPHMSMVIAYSGSCAFGEHWWLYLNKHAYPGIETLSWSVGEKLNELWAEWKREHPWPDGVEQEQSVHHFGISELTGELVAYSHFSWNNFQPEERSFRVEKTPVISARPACTVPTGEALNDFPTTFVAMMEEQRANQASGAYGPDHDREVSIGGELIVHHLNMRGCSIYKLARFDDYEAIESGLWGYTCAQWRAENPHRIQPEHSVPESAVVTAESEAQRANAKAFREALSAAAVAAGKSDEEWVEDVLRQALSREQRDTESQRSVEV